MNREEERSGGLEASAMYQFYLKTAPKHVPIAVRMIEAARKYKRTRGPYMPAGYSPEISMKR
jgi:hypothetical protein